MMMLKALKFSPKSPIIPSVTSQPAKIGILVMSVSSIERKNKNKITKMTIEEMKNNLSKSASRLERNVSDKFFRSMTNVFSSAENFPMIFSVASFSVFNEEVIVTKSPSFLMNSFRNKSFNNSFSARFSVEYASSNRIKNGANVFSLNPYFFPSEIN